MNLHLNSSIIEPWDFMNITTSPSFFNEYKLHGDLGERTHSITTSTNIKVQKLKAKIKKSSTDTPSRLRKVEKIKTKKNLKQKIKQLNSLILKKNKTIKDNEETIEFLKKRNKISEDELKASLILFQETLLQTQQVNDQLLSRNYAHNNQLVQSIKLLHCLVNKQELDNYNLSVNYKTLEAEFLSQKGKYEEEVRLHLEDYNQSVKLEETLKETQKNLNKLNNEHFQLVQLNEFLNQKITQKRKEIGSLHSQYKESSASMRLHHDKEIERYKDGIQQYQTTVDKLHIELNKAKAALIFNGINI